MTEKELKDIQRLLKDLKFERNLHSDGTHSYYKFPTVRATDGMVLQVLLVEFADQKDLIREWKLNKLGI